MFDDSHLILFPLSGPSAASATSGGILDRAIEAEDKRHGDFLRLVMLFNCPLAMSCLLCDAKNNILDQNVIIQTEDSTNLFFLALVDTLETGACGGLP